MTRVYERHFDHDEARRLREQGLSYRAIGDRLGVDSSAVWQVLSGVRGTEAYLAHNREKLRRLYRKPCIGGCGKLAWTTGGTRGMCPACAGRERTQTVRDDTLLCSTCHEWKPDKAYAAAPARAYRRGRDAECKPCAATRRRGERALKREQVAA